MPRYRNGHRDPSAPVDGVFLLRPESAPDEILARIEIQCALEGLAARWAAERGASTAQLELPRACLDEIDDVVKSPRLSAAGFARFLDLNNRFHRLVLGLTHCRTLRLYVEDEPATIFSLPKVARILSSDPARLHALLIIEQDQHHRIIEAIETGMGARAESLVREHASLGRRHLIELP